MSVTINDIARAAGVSRTTVSRVLNDSGYVKEETRNNILKAIRELNYTPSAIARSLSTNKTNTIGVIVPEINNPFFGEIIKGIGQVADEYNLNLILFNTDDNRKKELKALKLLKEQRIQGVIITPTYPEDDFDSNYLSTLENLGIPVILIDGHVECFNFSGVFIDHIKGAYDGTNALIEAGHKKIALITGCMNSRPAKDRLIGYKKALIMNNIPVDENYIFYGDYKHESAYEITKQILEMKDKPTAIFVMSNMMILGCMKAFYEENIRVPEDMAIIGFDKIEALNIVGMNISFINGPTIEMGRIGMKLLIDNLENKESNKELKRITLLPKLVLKGSEKLIKR
ncbi:LacI family DNA-binding transcriptional regulator [Paramaledivibacter caminithermalis]|uniref:Transcriptional regulator, LacI family n=1 Tax=Paramaledivibacter caminithermalis (strain DSM 15212 / CIP 107654 / DViRD3) TaxID=1121301 RepID=A0A1M6PHC6_PARC5|nr:LacI family DNA-binding transcriptional regulator [Paramaledivibacter caminithermalis]SHK07300.1 transcriptional regulator, LacI family [Paramaledivibacter caminithermalis DSM 15212]